MSGDEDEGAHHSVEAEKHIKPKERWFYAIPFPFASLIPTILHASVREHGPANCHSNDLVKTVLLNTDVL